MDTILEIQNLSKTFNKKEGLVLEGFNLSINKGQIIAVIGESGSGKTTLIRIISGLETADTGTISINNSIVNSDNIFVLPEKRNIGLVFQDYALFPHLTVAENISYGLSKNDAKKQRISEVLDLVNLTDFNNRYPHQLSGGQQQRVALARAIAPKPKILILDEPFSNLDESLKINLRGEVFNILKKAQVTTIFVTHDTKDAIAIADEIVILKNGKTLQKGTSKTLYNNPKNNYVAALFGTIINFTNQDLSYFGMETSNKKQFIRINKFIVNKPCEYQLKAKVIKTMFFGDYYLNTIQLPNNKNVFFKTNNSFLNDFVHLGFNKINLLQINNT